MKRVISALVLAPIVLACVWFGGFPVVVLATLGSLVVYGEWAHVTGLAVRSVPVVVGGATLAASVLLAGADHGWWALAVLIVGIAAAALPTGNAWLAGGLIYAYALGGALLALRLSPGLGLEAVVFVLVLVWATDTFAFLVGSRLGGPKLWERVSPRKTWSGFIGGIAGGVPVALGAAWLMDIAPSWPLAAVALFLSVLAHAGDLVESVIKRRFGIKDASRLIPGHGGLMDRVDGLIFAAVVAVAIGALHGGGRDVAGGLLTW